MLVSPLNSLFFRKTPFTLLQKKHRKPLPAMLYKKYLLLFANSVLLMCHGLAIHCHEELCIVTSARHEVVYLLHCLDRIHVGDALAEYPHAVEGGFVVQQIIATSA